MPGLRAPPPGGYYLPDHTRKRPFSAAREGAAKVPRPGESRTMPIFLDDAPRHIPPPQGQSCGDTNTFRAAAHERLLRRPNLATESARRQAVAEGRTQTRAMEIERDCERSALQLACVIPPYALAQLLGENPAFLPIDEGLAMLVAIIRSRGGAKNLHEATNMWRRLLTRMDERGVRHNERASRSIPLISYNTLRLLPWLNQRATKLAANEALPTRMPLQSARATAAPQPQVL